MHASYETEPVETYPVESEPTEYESVNSTPVETKAAAEETSTHTSSVDCTLTLSSKPQETTPVVYEHEYVPAEPEHEEYHPEAPKHEESPEAPKHEEYYPEMPEHEEYYPEAAEHEEHQPVDSKPVAPVHEEYATEEHKPVAESTVVVHPTATVEPTPASYDAPEHTSSVVYSPGNSTSAAAVQSSVPYSTSTHVQAISEQYTTFQVEASKTPSAVSSKYTPHPSGYGAHYNASTTSSYPAEFTGAASKLAGCKSAALLVAGLTLGYFAL